MAVIVLEAQAGCGPADDPGPRVIVADMEGNADLAGPAFADMHDEALAGE
jgi:hypothetical protein